MTILKWSLQPHRYLWPLITEKLMKRLLVPIDFSEPSVHAFRHALDIAERSGGSICLLHVISLPVLQTRPFVPVNTLRAQYLQEMKKAAAEKMVALISEYNTAGVRVYLEIVTGQMQPAILSAIRKNNIDLVIMGTKGATGLREWTIGSNTEKMVRTSPVPVLSVKSYPANDAVRNIVFPNTLDTENQEDLVMKVKALQNFFGATLHIIWVNTPSLFRQDSSVRERLSAFARRFMLTNYTINVFNYSNEEDGIAEFTRQINGDLIALGTNGSKGIIHLLNGSVAEDVVNHVPYPVWTYCTTSARKLASEKHQYAHGS